MKLLLVLATLVALLVACVAPGTLPKPPPGCDRLFIVSSAFPETERAALERAVSRWNAIATKQFCLRDAEPEEPLARMQQVVFRVPYKGEEWQSISARNGGKDFLGVYFSDTGRIGIVDSLDEDLFEAVALHEFGHAHGLDHTEPPSIMFEAAGTAYDFTPIDLAECQRVGACKKEDEDG